MSAIRILLLGGLCVLMIPIFFLLITGFVFTQLSAFIFLLVLTIASEVLNTIKNLL